MKKILQPNQRMPSESRDIPCPAGQMCTVHVGPPKFPTLFLLSCLSFFPLFLLPKPFVEFILSKPILRICSEMTQLEGSWTLVCRVSCRLFPSRILLISLCSHLFPALVTSNTACLPARHGVSTEFYSSVSLIPSSAPKLALTQCSVYGCE